MHKNNPIRTCVSCKLKAPQPILKRYRVVRSVLECGKGEGRSFYLCEECLQKDEKVLKKIIDKYIKGVSLEVSNLKEKLLNEQC